MTLVVESFDLGLDEQFLSLGLEIQGFVDITGIYVM